MHLTTTFIAFVASTSIPVTAVQVAGPPGLLIPRADGPGTPYRCDDKYNAASKKKTLLSDGATVHDLAMTMLETGCAMSGTAYPFGDKLPNGQPKTGDSADFGLFKNNWYMLRKYCSRFKGQSESQWKNGAVLNNNAKAAIQCQQEMIAQLGRSQFYIGQRGAGGAAGGADYGHAVDFIYNYLANGHTGDDMATYYNLHPV